MRNLCFYARAAQCELYGILGKKFEKYNIKISYVTQNNREKKILQNLGCKGNIYVLTEYIEKYWNDEIVLSKYKSLQDIEKKYELKSIWSLFYTDRFLIYYNLKDSKKFIKLHVTFFEKVIKCENPEYFFNESIAIFSSYLFYELGKKLNCKYIGFNVPTNFASSKFYFSNGLFNINPLADNIFKSNDLTDSEIESAKKYIKEILEKKYKPEYQKTSGFIPKIQVRYFQDILAFIYYKYINPGSKYDYENYITNKYFKLYNMRNFIKYHFFHKKYYKNPIWSEKFILFPLHFQPEGTTLVCAANYEKQEYAIDLIAKKIPGDYILYVKEHYTNLGHRPIEFYSKISKYPNVKIINPLIDSHELIKQSSAVIVLTSTVGWEALLYKKPVLMLGNFMYDSFPYVHKIQNIDLLPLILQKAIDILEKDQGEYFTLLTAYVAAFLKSLKNGSYILRNKNNLLSNNNVENIYLEINQIINKKQ